MKRGTWFAVAAALALFALGYLASPFWAARRFKDAAVSADVDRLEEAVDFPAVRESLKSQLTVALRRKVQADPVTRSNPLASIGLMMMPVVVSRMVDAFVTPDGIATIMTSGSVGGRETGSESRAQVQYEYGYRSLDRFAVTIRKADAKGADTPSFVFERRDVFAWKLIRIELPTGALDGTRR